MFLGRGTVPFLFLCLFLAVSAVVKKKGSSGIRVGSRAMRAPQFIRGFFNTVNTEVVSRWRATGAEKHGGWCLAGLADAFPEVFLRPADGFTLLESAHDAPAHAIDELQCFAPTEMPVSVSAVFLRSRGPQPPKKAPWRSVLKDTCRPHPPTRLPEAPEKPSVSSV